MAKRRQAAARSTRWDGWAPTDDELIIRAARHGDLRPFWASWGKDRKDSIEELRRAFSFQCGGLLSEIFDPSRIKHPSSPVMSEHDLEIHQRWREWRADMRKAGSSHHITLIAGAILVDRPFLPADPAEACLIQKQQFTNGIDLHVEIRKRHAAQKTANRNASANG